MRAEEVVAAVTTSYAGWLRSQRHAPMTEPRSHVWASGGRRCTRAMALDLLHPEEGWEDPSDESLARMHGGVHKERALISDLIQIGPRCSPPFEVIEGQQRIEIRDRDNTLLITGKTDGALRFQGLADIVPFECKSGVSFARAETLEDLERSPWTRHAPDQLLAYLLAKNKPLGMLILDRPGMPVFLPIVLEEHLERAEGFLTNARVAIDARFGRVPLPPFIEDVSECRRCSHFGKSCAPPLDFGPGLRIISDPVLEEALDTREKNREAHLDYERADRVAKRLRGVPEALVGEFHVRGHWQPRKVTELPPEVAKQYTTVKEEGSWIMDVERVPVTD